MCPRNKTNDEIEGWGSCHRSDPIMSIFVELLTYFDEYNRDETLTSLVSNPSFTVNEVM